MRFSLACAAAFAGFAAALPGWFDDAAQDVIANDELAVPGENPLTFCSADHSKEIVTITKVDLTPNPPQAGTSLAIQATGTVFEPIQQGAYINLVVNYGLIRLINTKADLCEQTEKADLACPINKGVLSVTKEVDLPKEIPPGKYTVHAEVVNADGKPITCLEAKVQFGGRSFEL